VRVIAIEVGNAFHLRATGIRERQASFRVAKIREGDEFLGQFGCSRNIGTQKERVSHSNRRSFEPLIGRSFGLRSRLIACLFSYLFLPCYGPVRKATAIIVPGSQARGKSGRIISCSGPDACAASCFPDIFPVIRESTSRRPVRGAWLHHHHPPSTRVAFCGRRDPQAFSALAGRVRRPASGAPRGRSSRRRVA
jgi:hypothetical protein